MHIVLALYIYIIDSSTSYFKVTVSTNVMIQVDLLDLDLICALEASEVSNYS